MVRIRQVRRQRKNLGARQAVNYGIFIKSNSHQTLAGTQVYLQAKTVSSIYSVSLFIT